MIHPRRLEPDHNIPVAEGSETGRTNIDPLCSNHHDLNTRRNLRRLGPPGPKRLITTTEYDAALTPAV